MSDCEYGVQASHLSPAIYVGRLDASGKIFADKAVMTPHVMRAVAEYAQQHFGGEMWANVGDLRIDITVTTNPATQEADHG